MKKHLLFIQGGGDDGYRADAEMVTSLKDALGGGYEINYPELNSDESLPDFGWPEEIRKAINKIDASVILVAHSLGASLTLKYLSETRDQPRVHAIFLLATPFWNGTEDWVQGLMLKDDFGANLPANLPVTMYHCRDDEEVPFDHLAIYSQKLPRASIRAFEKGGHQFDNDMQFLAKDIKTL